MTWHAAEMPDDALDPDSLVGRMLRPAADDVTWDSPKEVKLIGGRVTDAEGEPIMEIAFDADPDPLPLWRVMEQAYFNGRNPGCADHLGYAAEIEALRDWLLPEEPEPQPENGRYEQRHIIWQHNNKLRALLTEQTRIARGGAIACITTYSHPWLAQLKPWMRQSLTICAITPGPIPCRPPSSAGWRSTPKRGSGAGCRTTSSRRA